MPFHVTAAGDPPLPKSPYDQRAPRSSAAALVNQRRWPLTEFEVRPGDRIEATVRTTPVGYVQGKVKNPTQGYFDIGYEDQRALGTQQWYDKLTGEYIVGPFPEGNTVVDFMAQTGGYTSGCR